jgi:putative membrane protein insertion efficiency factor
VRIWSVFRRRPVLVRLASAAALLCLVGFALLAADLSRPPREQLTSRTALSAIRWYKTHWSVHLGAQCRFTPTCSNYAITVIERHGFLVGGWRTARRIARCGPWTPVGTVDVPD